MRSAPTLLPILATFVGIALFSAMDAVIKSASIAIGAYSAYLLRCVAGFLLIAPIWWTKTRRFPAREVLKIHLLRGVVVSFMGWTFFMALVRLPLAEGIAISFIAPLIALWLAAVLLKEKIGKNAIVAALLGLVGVLIIVGGKIGSEEMGTEATIGLVSILLSAVLYAWNLVLQRQQALVASPTEVSTFQNGIVCLVLIAGAPFFLRLPEGRVWLEIGAGALLAVGAVLFLSWAYARAEAQVLVPIEYSGFLWAVLFGWLYFGEEVSIATVAGAALIIIGCWIATMGRPGRSPEPEITAV